MTVGGRGMFMSGLAMFVSRSGVLLGLLVLAKSVVMGRLICSKTIDAKFFSNDTKLKLPLPTLHNPMARFCWVLRQCLFYSAQNCLKGSAVNTGVIPGLFAARAGGATRERGQALEEARAPRAPRAISILAMTFLVTYL